jgi:hypothetical protein
MNEKGVTRRSDVFYCGYHAVSPAYTGKYGIIQRRYQPYFSDFIGSCGPKELAILRNSKEFMLSAVEVKDYIEYDPKHHQYYFVLNYKNGRSDYLDGGKPEALLELLKYMATEGWCFPWDKTSIKDIGADGLVHDVADLFRSKDVVNVFGSTYSVLYSLSKLSPEKYEEVTSIPPILATAMILNTCGFEISPDEEDGYYIKNLLIPGRNCAHVENKSIGDNVKAQYLDVYRRLQ